MHGKKDIKITAYIISFLLILFLIRVHFLSFDYSNLYQKYIPNYKDKYNNLLDSFELMKENYNFIPAEVINLSFLNTNKLFILDKGLEDNVVENSYVVDKDGLVGIVKKSFKNFSVGLLKNSPNFKIAVEINDCYGTLVNSNNYTYIDDLINCSSVKKGDPIFTSKYSVSSSNILVGKINKIKNSRIYVNYASNYYKLKFVGIVYDN